MAAPLVLAGGILLRRAALWGFRRLLMPGLRWIGRGLSRVGNFFKGVFRRGGRMLSTIANLVNLGGAIDRSSPSHFEEVDVTVFGSPKATKRDLWRIAVAAAFGKVQSRNLGLLQPPGYVLMEYPLEGNAVRVVVRMETPYLSLLAGRLRTGRNFELYTGPTDDLRGGEWGFNSVLPGSTFGAGYPKTGFENRTLLTTAPTYTDSTGKLKVSSSPHPKSDKVSRSVAPVTADSVANALDPSNYNKTPEYLFYQLLTPPCESPLFAPTATEVPPAPPTGTTRVTDLISGGPFPLPTQNPDGTPPTSPLPPDNYTPPVPQPVPPPQGSSSPTLVNGQTFTGSSDQGLAVPLGTVVFGALNAALVAAEQSITGVPASPVSGLLGLGSNTFDSANGLGLQITAVNNAPLTPVLSPLNPFNGSSY